MSAKYGRYFLPLLPVFALLAAHAARAARRAGFRRLGAGASPGLAAALALLTAGGEARATLLRMPHPPRLYVNAFGGGDARVDTLFPHCDYFDAGVREAVLEIARRAEPAARRSTATRRWLTRYYAERDGRADLVVDKILPATLCHGDTACYVVVQSGRRYWHNEAVLDRLAAVTPWAVIDVGDRPAVRVYRMEPALRTTSRASPP